MQFIIFIAILGVLVLIHEFGHFILAKRSGMKVEEFGFGFPPRMIGKKIGETIYSINWIPLGGFVKIFGEQYEELDGGSREKSRSFVFKKPWQKSAVLLGGIAMNILLAAGIYYGLLASNGFRSDPIPLLKKYDFRFGREEGQVIVTGINKGSPAERAQIKPEDIIVRLRIDDGEWQNIKSGKQMIETVKNAAGKNVTMQFENYRNGESKTVTVVPKYDAKLKRPVIGIGMIDAAVLTYGGTEKYLSGFLHSYNVMAYNLNVMGDMIASSFRTRQLGPVAETVSGPIGIFTVIGDIVRTSGNKLVVNILNVTALLSLSLAVMNVLPFPALDGGRMVFVLYEWITRRRVNKDFERYVNLAGFLFLIALSIIISINDLLRLAK